MLRKLFEKYKVAIVYVLIGILTTIVNLIAYFPLYYLAEFSATGSNAIAWCVAVAFAFVANKLFVFRSAQWDVKHAALELVGFVACRFISGLLETVFLLIVVDVYNGNGLVWKLFAGCVVFILNYLGSRFLVFRNKNIPSE